MNTFYSINLKSGANAIQIYPNSGLSTDYNVVFPSTAPVTNNILKWDGATSSFVWYDISNLTASSTTGATFTVLSTVAGTPSSNGSFIVNRGSEANAALVWNETSDTWQLGTVGNYLDVCRTYTETFQDADLVAGILTVTHTLDAYPIVTVIDNAFQVIGLDVTHTDANNLEIDLNKVGTLPGTWTVVCNG